MEISGWVILSIFVVELLLRLYIEKHYFWQDHWNVFDFGVVVSDLTSSVLSVLLSKMFPVSILRIFRLCKLGRISKILRVFPQLRLMMAATIGAMASIFWGTVLLAFILLIWSIIGVQFIHPLIQDLSRQGVYDGCDRCEKAFSTVFNSCITFFQQIVAGDSWGAVTIPIIEYQPVTAVYFAAVFLSVGSAVLNLILALCVDSATDARQRLEQELVQEKILKQQDRTGRLLQICRSLDTDGSGELSREELVYGFDKMPEFRATLEELEFSKDDLEIVWIILDSDNSGFVSYTEFIAQLLDMKSSDQHFMLAYIRYYVTEIRTTLSKQMDQINTQVVRELDLTSLIESLAEKEHEKLDKLLEKSSQKSPVEQSGSFGISTLIPAAVVGRPMTNNVRADGIEMPEVFRHILEEARSERQELKDSIAGLMHHVTTGKSTEPQDRETIRSDPWMLPSCQQVCASKGPDRGQLLVTPMRPVATG